MARPKGSTPWAVTLHVKITQELNHRIEAVAERLGEPKSAIMRMALKLGLPALENVRAETDLLRQAIETGEQAGIHESKEEQRHLDEQPDRHKPKKKKAG